MQALTDNFRTVVGNKPRSLAFCLLPLVLTSAVLWFDVNKGIERLCKILMPLLLILMVLMAGRVLMLDGSNVGVQFFFQADFSKITPKVIMEAMGQSFFSLSIGMGALITYGAYMPKTQNVAISSIQVVVLDTLVAVLAGVIIFPAVFAFGFNPAEGPELVFVVLPAIFDQMSFSWFSSVMFFSLLCIAALTSTISLMEVAVAFLREATANSKHPLSRGKSVVITAGIVSVLIVGCVMADSVFDLFDQLTACILMPLGALGMSLFVGWFMPGNGQKNMVQGEVGTIKHWFKKIYIFLIRFIVPTTILLIFLNNLGML